MQSSMRGEESSGVKEESRSTSHAGRPLAVPKLRFQPLGILRLSCEKFWSLEACSRLPVNFKVQASSPVSKGCDIMRACFVNDNSQSPKYLLCPSLNLLNFLCGRDAVLPQLTRMFTPVHETSGVRCIPLSSQTELTTMLSSGSPYLTLHATPTLYQDSTNTKNASMDIDGIDLFVWSLYCFLLTRSMGGIVQPHTMDFHPVWQMYNAFHHAFITCTLLDPRTQASFAVRQATQTMPLLRSPPTPIYLPSGTSIKNEPLPSPMARLVVQCWDEHDWQQSSDALTDWLNARWKKTGIQVSYETICFHLRATGRDARIGLGDTLAGAFFRGPGSDSFMNK